MNAPDPLVILDNMASALDDYSPFRSFFQLNANAICILDLAAKIVCLNPSAETLLGPAADQNGQCFVRLFTADKQPELQQLLQRVLAGQPQRVELDLVCIDQQSRHFRMNMTPALNNLNQVIGVFCVLIDLTRKKSLLRALAESEKHYRQLVEFAPVAIIVHQQGRVLFANQTAQSLLMHSFSAADNLYDLVHPADRPLVLARRNQPVGTMLPFIEIKLLRHANHYIDVAVGSMQIIYNQDAATLSFFRDITQERKAQEALAASEAKYRMIADNMTDLVALTDALGKIKYASPSHQTVLGYPAEQLVGTTLADYLHPEDRQLVKQQFLQMVQQQQPLKVEFRMQNAACQWLWLETQGSLTDSEEERVQQFLLVSRNVTDRKMLEQQLSFMAFHDGLTQLPNRRLFNDRLQQAILEHQRSGQLLAVIYMDLDKFKRINDSLGHDIGDELLVAFAKRVKTALREPDTLARLGGDEFVILLPHLQTKDDVTPIAQRILAALQQPWQLSNCSLSTTSSMGIALFPQHAVSAFELIKQADLALYQAKENGRNGFAWASEVSQQVVQQLTLS